MKKFFLCLFILIPVFATAQSKDEKAILQLLDRQSGDWNRGDIDGFMNGYWTSDSLMFIGKSGVTYGWDNTLKNYKKGYPDTASMGKLNFTILKIKKLSKNFQFVVGKWHLKRSIGDVGGHFTLFFEKINNEWVIIADHSS